MSRFRVTIQFDLDLIDEDQAKTVAAEHWRRMAVDAQAKGGFHVSSIAGSPEVAAYEMVQHPQVTASSVAIQLLARGAQGQESWMATNNLEVRSEPLD